MEFSAKECIYVFNRCKQLGRTVLLFSSIFLPLIHSFPQVSMALCSNLSHTPLICPIIEKNLNRREKSGCFHLLPLVGVTLPIVMSHDVAVTVKTKYLCFDDPTS